jgi:hypothetical protein
MGGPNSVEAGAFHEAAHAVLATVHGLSVTVVSIWDLNNEYCETNESEPTTWDSARERLIVNFSGLTAQYLKHRSSCRTWHSCYDDRMTYRLAEKFGLDWQVVQEEAFDEVEKYWPIIERVAKHLLEKRRLSGEEVRDIVSALI